MNEDKNKKSINHSKKDFYKIGGFTALVVALIFRRNLGAELFLLREFGLLNYTPPETVVEWFTLIQDNKLLGLFLLDFFDVINYAFVSLVLLALYYSLKHTNECWSTIAVIFGFFGVIVCFASNQAFTMLNLSDQYTATTTIEQQSSLLAAGEAVLAINRGSGVYLSLFFVTLAGLIMALVMLQSDIFNKRTAYLGILAHGILMSFFIALIFAPALIALPPAISAVFLLIYYILIGRRLLQLNSSLTIEVEK